MKRRGMRLVKFFLKSDFWVVEQCSATHFVFLKFWQLCEKSFCSSFFQKVFAVKGAQPLSLSAESETTSAFLLDRVFFAPPICKEKPAMEFSQANRLSVYLECSRILSNFSSTSAPIGGVSSSANGILSVRYFSRHRFLNGNSSTFLMQR